MKVFEVRGRSLPLGEPIGRGGEATVYRLKNHPDRLAKIFEPAPRPNYPQKLAWMIAHPPRNPARANPHPSLAWPAGLLFNQQGKMVGYWMPFIQGAVPALEVFNPRRRALTLPRFDRRYLHRAARNLAAAVGALHRYGYVIGDLNENNVLITPSALVTLIDTDSFQVLEQSNGQSVLHPCPVGKIEYIPPELQGQDMTEVHRLPQHDAFSLGVLTFQLLMEGNHPFRAQWLDRGDPPPIEERIAQGAFPYMAAPPLPVRPPKHAPRLEWLHPEVAELFRRLFVDGQTQPAKRPDPAEWERAITQAEKALLFCAQGHIYSNHLATCPYCVQPASRIYSSRRQANAAPGAAKRTTTRPAGTGSRTSGTASPPSQRQVSGQQRSYWSHRQPPQMHKTPPQPNRRPQPAAATAGAGSTPFPGSGRPWWRRSGVWGSGAPGQAATKSRPSSSSTSRPGSAPHTLGNNPQARPAAPGWMRQGPTIFRWPNTRSPSQVINPRSAWLWFQPRLTNSIKWGGGLGLLAGIIPSALLGAVSWSAGEMAAWPLMCAIGGACAGALRGMQPARRLGDVIDRRIGWRNFWRGAGLLLGGVSGLMIGLMLIWLVLPVLILPLMGASFGWAAGGKVWELGARFRWPRLWAGLSAVGTALFGAGIAWIAAAGLPGGLIAPLADMLKFWLVDQSVSWVLASAAVGALAGATGGFTTGVFVDIVNRILGLRRD